VNASAERERIAVRIFPDHEQIARAVAGRVADLIGKRQSQGRSAVLGLATGSTPVRIYRELIRLHREEELDFANVITFNLDYAMEAYMVERGGHPVPNVTVPTSSLRA